MAKFFMLYSKTLLDNKNSELTSKVNEMSSKLGTFSTKDALLEKKDEEITSKVVSNFTENILFGILSFCIAESNGFQNQPTINQGCYFDKTG